MYCQSTVSLTSAGSDIRYVLAGGWSNGSSLDNLRFNVPEPGTLALFALGLASMGFARRRRERISNAGLNAYQAARCARARYSSLCISMSRLDVR